MDLFIDNADYIRFTDTLSQLFKKIKVSYSCYCNHIYGHAGDLFQNRYRREPISYDQYFLSAFRYILRNPENAGISKWNEYPQSSAKEYIDHKHSSLTDTGFITGIPEQERIMLQLPLIPFFVSRKIRRLQ